MPGIVGLITSMPRVQAEARLHVMVQALRHESFYVSGTWIDEKLGVYVGWVERDATAARMPLRNQRKDLALIFSGEEFSDHLPHHSVREKGHVDAPNSREYLVHLSEEDTAFPASLNGRFHGLSIDSRQGTAKLFNDRYGLHRIYYHEAPDTFFFAAEAKAILAVRPELRNVDLQGLGEFISCGCVLEDRTLFKDIRVLPGASVFTFRDRRLADCSKYFDRNEWERQEPLNAKQYYEAIREVFSQVLPRYFDAQQPIGMSLTGGLDTRMVMAWHKAAPGSLPSYTFGGMFRDCRDVRIARQIAAVCEQPHEVISVGDDFLSQFPRYAERAVFLSDGCADVSRAADLYVNELARQIAPIRMTGNYGGEVMRGVRAFKPVRPRTSLYQTEVMSSIAQAEHTYEKTFVSHPLSFAVFEQATWHHYGLLALEQTQIALRTPYLDNEFVRTVYRAPKLDKQEQDDLCLKLIGAADTRLRRIPTDRGLGGDSSAWLSSMRHACRELEFKCEYAYDYGMPDLVAPLDAVLKPVHLERLFLGRHKFFHYRLWYRDRLSRYVQDMLLDAKSLSRSYVDAGTLRSVVESHLTGQRNRTLELHKLLTLELIHRQLLDDAVAVSSEERVMQEIR
ncbi:MAG TPA: asparagine synthase-related protein [Candidatus Nanoarchaeia archaeon]|nr:asparagine synthase-related protein [Candidatus Nanoarchaeia archaeon]